MNFTAPLIVDNNSIENELSKTTKELCGKKKSLSKLQNIVKLIL